MLQRITHPGTYHKGTLSCVWLKTGSLDQPKKGEIGFQTGRDWEFLGCRGWRWATSHAPEPAYSGMELKSWRTREFTHTHFLSPLGSVRVRSKGLMCLCGTQTKEQWLTYSTDRFGENYREWQEEVYKVKEGEDNSDWNTRERERESKKLKK